MTSGAAPQSFEIPTTLVVDLLKLVGEIPSRHGAKIYLELQQLKPTEKTESAEPAEPE